MKAQNRKELLRKIPSLEKLLSSEEFINLKEKYSRSLILDSARKCIETLREKILISETTELIDSSVKNIYSLVREDLENFNKKGIRRAINATGVVLHTNLGRSPLCDHALKRLDDIVKGYCTLEIDNETGKRGTRHRWVEELLLELTGADAAVVVNNDSAAVFLVLQTLTKDKEVIISRGELVEIGGGFRVPQVMESSGCRLVEIGTTNKTRLSDYKEAINEHTGMILKVHTSNFKIIGFTESVSVEALAELAKNNELPLFYDQGNGLFVNLDVSLGNEPNVIETIKAGVDIVAFSGDKLLGGPQAGIIIGRKKYIEPIKRNPLMRALRLDKMALATLEATLEEYLNKEMLGKNIPVIRMLKITPEELKLKAEELAGRIMLIKSETDISVIEGLSEIGGGSLPGITLPTFMVSIKSPFGAKIFQEKLRRQIPSVYVRIVEEQVVFDVRTITGEDNDIIVMAIKKIFEEGDSVFL